MSWQYNQQNIQLPPRVQKLESIQNPPHQSYYEMGARGPLGPKPQKQFGQNYSGTYQKQLEPYQQEQPPQQHMPKSSKNVVTEIKRNITDGAIPKIDDLDTAIELRGNEKIQENNEELIEYLIQCHIRKDEKKKSNYQENLKNGEFVKISDQVLWEKENQGFDEEEDNEDIDQFASALYKLIADINSILIKLLYLIQGIFSGYSLMHTVMMYLEEDKQRGMDYFSSQGQRLAQAMQLLAIFCFVGSMHLYLQSDYNLIRGVRAQSGTRSQDVVLKSKAKFTIFFYLICYVLVIVGHPWISKMSDRADKIQAKSEDFSKEYDNYKIVIIIITLFAGFGWMLSVSNIKSPIDYSLLDQSQLEDIDDESDNDLDI